MEKAYARTAGFAGFAADGERLFAVSGRDGDAPIGGSDGRVYLRTDFRAGRRTEVRSIELASRARETYSTRLARVPPAQPAPYEESNALGLLAGL